MTDKLPRFKPSCFLNITYKELYPLSGDIMDKILDGYNINNRSMVCPIDDLYVSMGSTSIVIYNRSNPSKKPTIINICNILKESDIEKAVIILAGFSKSCKEYIKNYNDIHSVFYKLKDIKSLMKPEQRSTVPILLGRYANQSYGKAGKPKQKITILVPEEGFPDIGFVGKLNASDIYKILESKVEPSNNSFEAKGFDIVMTAFEEITEILNNGKNVTSTKWNAIMEKSGGVFEYLESEE